MKVHIASSTKPFCLFLQVTFPSAASETKIDYYQEKINGRNISRFILFILFILSLMLTITEKILFTIKIAVKC